jgi:hypothetical protein
MSAGTENAGFNVTQTVRRVMKCHYCDREASVAAESEGVKVGLCDDHFRDRLEELAEADELKELQEHIDVDRPE